MAAVDCRQGNLPPAEGNLAFIQQCEQSLPEGCFVQALPIDAADYQAKIIQYCDENNIRYAIWARISKAIKAQIDSLSEVDWQLLLNKEGQPVDNQDTYRTTRCIGDYDAPCTLIIQRTGIQGQVELDIDPQCSGAEIYSQGYTYRAIATNQDDWSDSRIIYWYNQRGEDSKNRIKELKLDFGGDTLPC